MAYDLDSPTVFRVGQSTLGVPTLSLDYRPGGPSPVVPIPVSPPPLVIRLAARVDVLEARVAALETPWYHRLLHWLLDRWPF